MPPTFAVLPSTPDRFSFSKHAYERMVTRSISRTAVEAALALGRCVETRGAQIFAIGRKEVARYKRDGIDLSKLEGTQVVVAGGAVITVYRNSNFKSLRARPGHRYRR